MARASKYSRAWIWPWALACLPIWAADAAQSSSARESLRRMAAELQERPHDQELRERIIKGALALKPAPAVPREAARHLNRGRAAFAEAKSPAEIGEAVAEFEAALAAAPWWGIAYYNLGLAQEKAGDYAAAQSNLQLYLLATPIAKDAEAVQGLIDGIEYKQEKASRTPAAASPADMSDEKLIDFLNGARFSVHIDASYLTLDIADGYAIFGYATKSTSWEESSRVAIRSRTFTLGATLCDVKHSRSCPREWTIAQDGSYVTERSAYGNGRWSDTIMRRER